MSVKMVRIDDLEENEVPADETLQVGLDGKWVELDLCSKNATRVRNTLAPYMAAGQSVSAPRAVTRARLGVSSAQRDSDRGQKQAVREWLRAQGHKVSHKGRIPQDLQELFDAAHAPKGHPVREPEFSSV